MKNLICLLALLISTGLFGQIPQLDLVVEELDQSVTSGSGRFYGGDNWQSFTAGKSGFLRIVRAYHYHTTEKGTLYIYEGVGTTGKLLHQQTYSATGTHFLYFKLNGAVRIQKGKSYTLRLSNFRWFVSRGNDYPDGYLGRNPARDLIFQTYVQEEIEYPNDKPLNQITDAMLHNPGVLGAQQTTANLPAHRPQPGERRWTYDNNIQRKELNTNGLGRCYDIRKIDLLDWTEETLEGGQANYVVEFFRDNQRRPARWNNIDYVKPKGVEFTATPNDRAELQNEFITSAQEFSNETMQEYRGSVGIPNVGALTASTTFSSATSSSEASSSLSVVSKLFKKLYKLDLQFDNPAHRHYINPRFWNAVKQLGHQLSAEEFTRKFGTHYASTAHYGGNFMQIRTVNHDEYAYNSSSKSEFKLDVDATLQQVEFGVGTTQRSEAGQGQSKMIKMESARLYTVGGDLNMHHPDKWSQTVKHNPTVVNGRLTRISDLLTAKNFPEIPNILHKQQLLEAAIQRIEKGVGDFEVPQMENNFWTKKDAVFELSINTIKCTQQDEGKSQYSGNVSLYFFGDRERLLESPYTPIFTAYMLELGTNDSRPINQKYKIRVPAKDIENGFAALPGKFVEYEVFHVNYLPDYSPLAAEVRIPFKSALFAPKEWAISWQGKYDRLEIDYALRKIEDPEGELNTPKPIRGEIKVGQQKEISVSQSALKDKQKIQFSLSKKAGMDWWKAVKIYDSQGELLQSLELSDKANGPISSREFNLSQFTNTIRVELWKQKTFGIKLPAQILYLDRIDCQGKNTSFYWHTD